MHAHTRTHARTCAYSPLFNDFLVLPSRSLNICNAQSCTIIFVVLLCRSAATHDLTLFPRILSPVTVQGGLSEFLSKYAFLVKGHSSFTDIQYPSEVCMVESIVYLFVCIRSYNESTQNALAHTLLHTCRNPYLCKRGT